MKLEYLEVGKIVGCRGLKGELKVRHFCDSCSNFLELKRLFVGVNKTQLDVSSMRAHKSIIVMTLKNVNSLEESTGFVNKIIYAKREDIKISKDRYFIQDIIGLQVFDDITKEHYGNISDVLQTGANDVYVVNRLSGGQFLIPAIGQVISGIVLEEKAVFIKPMDGMVDL